MSGLSTGRATGRVDVIARMTRRRHWSTPEKLEMLEAAFGPGGSVSAAMRRFEVTSGLLYTWRRQHRAGQLGGVTDEGPPVFVRVDAAGGAPAPPLLALPGPAGEAPAWAPPGVIALDLPSGARLRIEGTVDGRVLAQVLRLAR